MKFSSTASMGSIPNTSQWEKEYTEALFIKVKNTRNNPGMLYTVVMCPYNGELVSNDSHCSTTPVDSGKHSKW